MTPTERKLLERELLLASAGSGKTWQLSSRLIGLLAVGCPPEEILASTFTRKAAGEILDRVLVRLAEGALSEAKALELATSVPEGVPRELLTSEGCGRILVRALSDLHRLQIHTLDAFFHRVVRAFSLELGLPAEWAVVDEPTGERLRSRALEEALAEGDPGVLAQLVRAAGKGDADRSVHGLLLEQIGALLDLWRERDAAQPGPDFWGGPEGPAPAGDARIGELLTALRLVDVPLTKAGTPRAHWAKSLTVMIDGVEEGDWEAFLGAGLMKKLVAGEETYDRVHIWPGLRELLVGLTDAAASHLRAELRRRVQALGRFVPDFERRLRRLREKRGTFDFKDLTYALGELDRPGSLAEIHYRLDGRIRHVLLDEFQDTSIAQWAALEPLVGEILSGYEGERAAFVVADPKQSIYGWRDGEPRILDRIRDEYGIEPSSMALSWRSSPVVLDLVNRVFEGIEDNPVLAEDARVRGVALRWAEGFETHEAARPGLPGHVVMETGPAGDTAREREEARLVLAARRVVEVLEAVPGATIGALTRRNRTVARLIALLREMGVEASEEGGVPVADSAPVVAILALLRMADHPGDRISRYLVAGTPLGAVVGLTDWRSPAVARDVSRKLRDRLLREGYGMVLAGWVRALDPMVSERDRNRLRKLLELAFRWEDQAGLRPGDFVRAAEAARAERVGESRVRIMTVYRAKGLEFDVVVLPELDRSAFTRGSLPAFVPERSHGGAGAVRCIHASPKRDQEPLFPEIAEAAAQYRESRIRDSLSALYVALTRARFQVRLIMDPDPEGTSKARSDARVLREALLEPGAEAPPETPLLELGHPDWSRRPEAPERLLRSPPSSPRIRRASEGPALSPSPRRRLIPRRAPSDLEGGDEVSLEALLRPLPRGALERGTLVHAWLETVEWLPDGDDEWAAPGTDERERLMALARETVPGATSPGGLLDELRGWLQAPSLRALLIPREYPEGTLVERELPFLARDEKGILQGVADRVLRLPAPSGSRLVVVDWKTDRIESGEDRLEARAAHYRPQMEAYLRALAGLEGIEVERVEGIIAFLREGWTARVELH
jgi:ATP-dependent helicase/nuclease subunit A